MAGYYTAGQKLKASDLMQYQEVAWTLSGTTTVNNSTTTDFTAATFTMPWTGLLFVSGVVGVRFVTGGVQTCDTYIYGPGSTPTTTNQISGPLRTPGGTGASESIFTVPLYARWTSIAAGTAVTIKLRMAVGSGGINCQMTGAEGSYRICHP